MMTDNLSLVDLIKQDAEVIETNNAQEHNDIKKDTSSENEEVSIKSNEDEMELYSDAYPFSLPLRISDFANDSEYGKFIKNCEKLIRSSIEYKMWRSYLIDVLKINSCFITHETMDECKLEIHHHLPSLYAVVKSIVNKKISNKEPFATFDICTEAIELHYMNKIGFIPVITNIHEKIHNGSLKVPIHLVQGDYKYFIDNYMQYLDDDDVDTINERLAYTNEKAEIKWSKNNYPGIDSE